MNFTCTAMICIFDLIPEIKTIQLTHTTFQTNKLLLMSAAYFSASELGIFSLKTKFSFVNTVSYCNPFVDPNFI